MGSHECAAVVSEPCKRLFIERGEAVGDGRMVERCPVGTDTEVDAHAREIVRLKCVEPAKPSEVPLRVEEVCEPLQIGPDDDVVARICLESGSLDEGPDFDSKVRILEFTDASEQESGCAR